MKLINCFSKGSDLVLRYRKSDNSRWQKKIQSPYYFLIKNTSKNLQFLKKTPVRFEEEQDIFYIINYEPEGTWIKVYCPRRIFRGKAYRKGIDFFETNGIKTYEADLGPKARYCLDNDIEIENFENLKVLYFDIETTGLDPLKHSLLSFAGISSEDKSYFLHKKTTEKDLLKEIELTIRPFDMLVGWNSKNFDLPFLFARARQYKFRFQYLWNILHEDLMKRLIYFYSKDPVIKQKLKSYSLDAVAQCFLGEGKHSKEEGLEKMFKRDLKKFKRYNLQDCDLVKRLEKKLHIIETTVQMAVRCRIFPKNFSIMKSLDNFILNEAKKRKIHFLTNFNNLSRDFISSPEKSHLTGGAVLPVISGFHENVQVLDYVSLYPNIIRTFNIGTETKTPQSKDTISTPRKTFFISSPGILATTIGNLLTDRKKIKKRMKEVHKNSAEYKNLNVRQLIVKELSNSIYGIFGTPFSRYFDLEIAESITYLGQWLLSFAKTYFEKRGFKVLLGDTDSLALQLNSPDKKIDLQTFNQTLEKNLKRRFGITHSYLELGLDKFFESLIILTKKKYFGQLRGGELKNVGGESIKRDTIEYGKRLLNEFIQLLLERKTALLDLKLKLIKEKEKLLKGKSFLGDFIIYKKIGKNLGEYKSPPLHVRILEESKKPVRKGMLIGYYITTTTPKLQGVLVEDLGNKKPDWEYYWARVIYPPIQRILETLYLEHDWKRYK